jgi:uncharacterized glyoxalase superfamily protein PhnB
MAVKAIPEGFHTVTPYLAAQGAAALIDFLLAAFDAREVQREALPDGRIINAQIQVGDSMVLVADAPPERKPAPATFYMYLEDVDAAYEKAVRAGGISIEAPADQFYGDRTAAVTDPAGNHWYMATHVEDVSGDDIVRRALDRRRPD